MASSPEYRRIRGSRSRVTLDRVICCYHDVEGLLGAASSKARSAVGLVFPRENFLAHAGFLAINTGMRLLRNDFRGFIHPHSLVDQILADAGFELATETNGFVWRTAVFVKR